MKTKIIIAASLSLLLALATGCSDTDMLPEDNNASSTKQPMQGVVRVPITIALGGSGADEGSGGSRVAPPGIDSSGSDNSQVEDKDDGLSETKGVNAVRVVAFRRRTSEETEDFEYDPKNNILLENLEEKDVKQDDYYEGQPHKHLVATGKVSISEGYDYRIVAIAYNKDEKAPYPYYGGKLMVGTNMLNLYNGTTYNDFCAKFADYMVDDKRDDRDNNWFGYLKKGQDYFGDLFPSLHSVKSLTRRLATIPQIFFGVIHIKDDASKNPIVSYTDFLSEKDSPIPSLTGTLYRGMAEVVVNIKSTSYDKKTNPEWYCLLADNVLTKVRLHDYDDFKHGSEPVEKYKVDKKTYGTYTAVAYQKCAKVGDIITLKAYMLPCKTHFAIRVGYDGKPHALNRQIKAKDVSSADAPTGVIIVDALNDLFYLRRNHKYVFNYTTDKGLSMDKNTLLD